MSRLRPAALALRPTARAVSSTPLAAAAAGGLVLIELGNGHRFPMQMAALALAVGAAHALDDDAAATVAATPLPLLVRRLLRLAVAVPAVALCWSAELAYGARFAHRLDLERLTLELAALTALAIAVAAVAGGTAAVPATLLAFVAGVASPQLALFDGSAGAAMRLYVVLVLSIAVATWGSLDPARRRRHAQRPEREPSGAVDTTAQM